MHINHQAKGQGDSILVWNLNLSTSVIYTLVDAIAQGVLVRPKLQKRTLIFFSLFLLRYSAVGRCGTDDWLS